MTHSAKQHVVISELIPHAGAMCLLERVIDWDSERIECEAGSHRAVDNPLRSDGRLPVAAGIEYAAQAAAVHGGLLLRPAAALAGSMEAPPRRGFLAVLGQVRWSVERLDDCAAPLRVEARRQSAGPDGAAYDFALHAAGRLLLEGSLVVALAPLDYPAK